MLSAQGRAARAALALLLGAACPLSLSAGDSAGRDPAAPAQARARVQSRTRKISPRDIAVPLGYHVEAVATGLTFPSAVLFDDAERVFIVEAGYATGDSWAEPRLLRLEPDDSLTTIAKGDRNGPWTGAVYSKGYFYISEGGVLEGGKILRVDQDTGRPMVLVDGLPSTGDHPTDPPALGPDGYLYFGQGTVTNSGVVGDDNRRMGWVSRYPDAHDTPCADVTLAGSNFDSPLGPTGAFLPQGASSTPGQVIKGRVPCNGAVFRVPLTGKPEPQLVAWGFRDPFGIAFDPQGKLFVVDSGYDERGSRPIWGAADLLWRVSTGTWYGWPDYSGDKPVVAADFRPDDGGPVRAVFAKAPGRPPRPAAQFGVHSAAHGLDFSRSDFFGHVGEAFVAEFGDLSPFNGRVAGPVGFKVVRVDPQSGVIEDFAVNKGKINGPASMLGTGGLERPVAARFSPDGRSLFVVDFGIVTASADGAEPVKGTGVLWKITRDE